MTLTRCRLVAVLCAPLRSHTEGLGRRPQRASECLPPSFSRGSRGHQRRLQHAPCSRFPAKALAPLAHPLLAARQRFERACALFTLPNAKSKLQWLVALASRMLLQKVGSPLRSRPPLPLLPQVSPTGRVAAQRCAST